MATVFYRPQALETIARRTLSEYDPMYLNGSPRAVPIETIIEKTFGLRIEYQYLTNDARELGRMIYDSGITTYYNRDIMDYALMRVEGGTMLIEAALLDHTADFGSPWLTSWHITLYTSRYSAGQALPPLYITMIPTRTQQNGRQIILQRLFLCQTVRSNAVSTHSAPCARQRASMSAKWQKSLKCQNRQWKSA